MSEDIPLGIKIVIVFGFIAIGYLLFGLVMSFEPDEQHFCEEQGYDYTGWPNGNYKDYKNEDYGRIICSKYFVEGRETKEFNVTETKWGFVLQGDEEK